MKPSKILLPLFLYSLLGASFSSAQETKKDVVTTKEVGNGGDGYRFKNRIYVLDLFENGVQDDPYLSTEIEMLPWIEERVARALQLVPSAPVELIARKLSHLYQLDQTLTYNIVYALEAYGYKMLSEKLPDIQDEDSIFDIRDKNPVLDPVRYVQLAIRRAHSIYFDKNFWLNDLDAPNRAALIFHEIVYALMPPQYETSSPPFQDSYKARAIVGFLFSKEMKLRGRDRLVDLAPEQLLGRSKVEYHEESISYFSDWSDGVRVFLPKQKELLFNVDTGRRANRNAGISINADTKGSVIEEQLNNACRQKFRYEEAGALLSINPVIEIKDVRMLPKFSIYRSTGNIEKIYFEGASRMNIFYIGASDEVSSVNVENCVKQSMLRLRYAWENVYGTPFPVPESPKKKGKI